MRTLVAILAMSSSAIFAQTHSPAQPASTPTLQASLVRPVLSSVTPPAAAAVTASASTGVSAPKLLHQTEFIENSDNFMQLRRQLRTLVLDLTVDATGKVSGVKVLASNDPTSNPGVIRAVSQYQYQPAVLDGVAVPVHVKMTYNITPQTED